MSDTTLFSDIGFNVSAVPTDSAEALARLIRAHGGHLSDKSDDINGTVYVLESFEQDNGAFSELVSKNARVVSSRCLFESISLKKPLPNSAFPLYARFLEDSTIALDESVDPALRAGLASITRYLGGTVVDGHEKKAKYLIADKVGSISYKLANQHGTTFVTSVWLRDCWSEKKFRDPQEYILPPFRGLVIAVTGLSYATRCEVERLSTAYGALYMPNLSRRCTHLLTGAPEGVKYRYAVEWGVHCVTTQWFFDSINKKACQDETKYFVPMSEAARSALLHPANITRMDISRLSPALRRTHLMKLTGASDPISNLSASVHPTLRPPQSRSKKVFNLKTAHGPHVDFKSLSAVSAESEKGASKAIDVIRAKALLGQAERLIEYYQKLGSEFDLSEFLDQLQDATKVSTGSVASLASSMSAPLSDESSFEVLKLDEVDEMELEQAHSI